MYRSEYLEIDDRIVNQYVNGGPSEPLHLDSASQRNDVLYTTRAGGVFTGSWKPNDDNKFFIRALANQNTTDDTQTAKGLAQDVTILQRQSSLRYTNERLVWGQMAGDHRIGDFFLDWRGAYSQSKQDVPDSRYITYNNEPPTFSNDSLGGSRWFSTLTEYSTDLAMDFTRPFTTALPFTDAWSGLPAKLKFGPAYSFRDRDFEQRRFEFIVNQAAIDPFQPPETILNPSNIVPGVIDVQGGTKASDHYAATQEIWGGYGLLELPILSNLKLVAGVRVEYSYIRMLTGLDDIDPAFPGVPPGQQVTIIRNDLDPLPSANLIFQPRDDMNVRAGWSWSVSRPEFRELSPAVLAQPRGLRDVKGNPHLVEAHLDNYDARWEWFFSPLELVSLSFFHKFLQSPIVPTVENAASSLLDSWQNGSRAWLTGFEFEGRKNFGFLHPRLTGLSLVANVEYHKAQVVSAQPSATQIPLQQNEALPDAAPYIVNATLEYQDPWSNIYRLLYNTAGKTVVRVGQANPSLPSLNLEPRNQLDAVMIFPFKLFDQKFTLKLAAENLLNDDILFTQGGNVQQQFKKGIKTSIGLTYAY